jgi:hypothetical protein
VGGVIEQRLVTQVEVLSKTLVERNAEIQYWRSVIGDAIFGLRHQPDVTREDIAEALEGSLVDGMPRPENERG